jgi:hypothetical protein
MPPFLTGHGEFGFALWMLSTFSLIPIFLDSEDPFCLKNTVNQTKRPIWRNSLSQFSKVDCIKMPGSQVLEQAHSRLVMVHPGNLNIGAILS